MTLFCFYCIYFHYTVYIIIEETKHFFCKFVKLMSIDVSLLFFLQKAHVQQFLATEDSLNKASDAQNLCIKLIKRLEGSLDLVTAQKIPGGMSQSIGNIRHSEVLQLHKNTTDQPPFLFLYTTSGLFYFHKMFLFSEMDEMYYSICLYIYFSKVNCRIGSLYFLVSVYIHFQSF